MALYREEGTTHRIAFQLIKFSSAADPKHPRRILHFQGQTLDELHLLRRKNN